MSNTVQKRYVLRWNVEDEWGHLSVLSGESRPVLVGFVCLDDNPVLRALSAQRSEFGEGMREVWFCSPEEV